MCAPVTKRVDAGQRFAQPSRGQPAARDRVLDPGECAPCHPQRLTHQQHVASRLQRRDRNPGGGEVRRHGVHLEIVAEEDAAKAEPATQQRGADTVRQGRGPSVEGGEDDVRGHERRDAGADGPLEGDQIAPREDAAGRAHAWQDEMRVADARAVTGKVLAATEHPAAFEPTPEGAPEPSHEGWARAKGSVADDPITRVRPHIEHWREVEVEAERRQLAPHGSADRGRERRRAGAADGGHRRKMREGTTQPMDTSPFVIDGNQGGHTRSILVELRNQRPELSRRAHIPPKEHDAARAVFIKKCSGFPIQARPGNPYHEELSGRPSKHRGCHAGLIVARSYGHSASRHGSVRSQVVGRYIAVEGPIGVGKTALARRLATEFDARLLLEQVEENPFLRRFYEDPAQHAFQTQLYFLLERYRQQRELGQLELFSGGTVADYLFAKDNIFASITLNPDEFALYRQVFELLDRRLPPPDLVIYLEARPEVLLKRLRKRDREFERNITEEYLVRLTEAFRNFFHHYSEAPLLVVNCSNIDFVEHGGDLADLIKEIRSMQKGVQHYIPLGSR